MPVQSAPITPQEAERVWKSQPRPSARTVATALTHAGRPVHFTTVARWKRQGLLTIARSGDPLAGTQGVRTPQSAEPETVPEDPYRPLSRGSYRCDWRSFYACSQSCDRDDPA
jgi:hypothetical protein